MRIDCLTVEVLENTAVHIGCLTVEVLENTAVHINCLTVEVLENTAVHIDCLTVEVLENTAVHIDCFTARVTAVFSFCERKVWVMRYVHTDRYVINIVCFLLSAVKHESRLRL